MASASIVHATISSKLPCHRSYSTFSPHQKIAQFQVTKNFSAKSHNIVAKTIPNFSLPNSRSKSFTCKSQATESDSPRISDVQELFLYELNEGDRGSPVYLHLSGKEEHSLGDLVPLTNKIYSGDLQKRLGITAGITILIKSVPEKNGDMYETIYSFYLGKYGSLSVQGPYLTYDDSYLTVTGGTGIFEGVTGQMLMHQIVYPTKLLHTFYLRGIPKLPTELTGAHVDPSPSVKPSPAARNLEPEGVIEGYSN